MKKFISLFILLVCSTAVFAQFKLSGKINHYSGTEVLSINIPVAYGFYEENSIKIPVAKNGTFAITLPVKQAKFANLIFQKYFRLLLLNPNKNLVVEFDEADKKFSPVSGSALPESKLMGAINIEEYPFFLKNSDSYNYLNLSGLNTKVVKPYLAMRDKKLAQVNQSSINAADKKLIAAEVKYAAYNYLFDLRDLLDNKAVVYDMIIGVYDKVNAKPDVFPGGPQYYTFVHNYLDYIEKKSFARIKQEHIQPNQPMPYYGIPLNQASKLSAKYGTNYMRWLAALKVLPDAVTEIFAYQQILHAAFADDLIQTENLATPFMKKFPKSAYNANIRKRINAIKAKK